MKPLGKSALLLGLLLGLGGCSDHEADLASVLAPASGRIADADGRKADIAEVLASARGRPVSVSFAYVGCGGRTPRLDRLRDASAALGAAADGVFHIVLNAVDEPSRYGDLVRDLSGNDAPLDPDRLRVFFVDKGERWPKEPSAAVDGVLEAMNMRYGRDRLIETVNGIGFFDKNGAFLGIRY